MVESHGFMMFSVGLSLSIEKCSKSFGMNLGSKCFFSIGCFHSRPNPPRFDVSSRIILLDYTSNSTKDERNMVGNSLLDLGMW